jgi:hypothetical protein
MNKNIDFGTVADLYDVYVQWDVDIPFFREAAAAGFKVLHLWGDYSRGQFEPERSPFMIWELGGEQ